VRERLLKQDRVARLQISV